MEDYIRKLLKRAEFCNDNLNAISKQETVRIVMEVINLLREKRIPNLRANDEDLCVIIYNIMKDENYRFTDKLGKEFNRQAQVVSNQEVQLEPVLEENILEVRKMFSMMQEDTCYMDFNDRSLNQIMEYLVSKNRENPAFENRYTDVKSDMKKLIEREYVKYISSLAEQNANLMITVLKRDNEDLLMGNQKNNDNQLDEFIIS